MEKRNQTSRLLVKAITTPDEKTVKAIVTAPTQDRDGDVIDTQSLRLPLKGGGFVYAKDLTGNEAIDIPFLIDHDFSVMNVIGSVRSAIVNAAGELEVTFGMSSRAIAQEMHTLLVEGHLDNAFSQTIMYDYSSIMDGAIYDAEIEEISLVFRGSNKQARLLEVSKSLLRKGQNMDDTEKQAKLDRKAELEKALAALNKEIDEPAEQDKPTPDAPTEAPAETQEAEAEQPAEVQPVEEPKEVKTEDAPVAVPTVEAPAVSSPAPEQTQEQPKPIEDTPPMETASKSIASKAAGTTVSKQEDAPVVVERDENAHKLLVVKQINAANRKDWQEVDRLNKEAMRLDEQTGLTSKAIKSKEISRADGAPLYLAEQLNRDIETCYGDYGNLGQLVTPITLTTSPKFRTITSSDDVDFQPVGWAGTKPQDEAAFGSVAVEPKPFAVIQVWNDHVAEDAAINLYNIMTDQVARARARLEDNLILNFATVTTADSVVYPTQGILARLASGYKVTGLTLDNNATTGFIKNFGAALAKIRGCDSNNITLVVNRTTWIGVGLMTDTQGRLLFTDGGNGVFKLGNVGSFRVVTSDLMPAGKMLIGNFKRYYLGQKEGLQLMTSSEATVGSLNLFETDHSALRAVVRYEGNVSTPSLSGSFVEIDLA